MDLTSGAPFWPVRDGLLATYPALTSDIECDVLVLGAGVTGALCAWQLVEAGLDTVVVDAREIGWGSTSASTDLLMYDLDTSLVELTQRIGRERAEGVYREARHAVEKLCAMHLALGPQRPLTVDRRPSLYLASRTTDAPRLARECEARRAAGLEVELWDRTEIARHFPFSRAAALWHRDAGEVDPLALTHALLADGVQRGLRVFDRSKVDGQRSTIGGRGSPNFRKAAHRPRKHPSTVDRRPLTVYATGYETEALLRQPAVHLHDTYAFASEPVADLGSWHERALLWETARPYIYLRTTDDNRVLVGGGDDRHTSPERRDRALAEKTETLLRRARRMFPDLDLVPAFAWAGTFAESDDGMPYIGCHPGYPDSIFAACYGGNGTVFAMLASEIVRDWCLGRKNEMAEWFGFGR
jgi:glycine/D-amino acid oxidase-like deaminating enzyme